MWFCSGRDDRECTQMAQYRREFLSKATSGGPGRVPDIKFHGEPRAVAIQTRTSRRTEHRRGALRGIFLSFAVESFRGSSTSIGNQGSTVVDASSPSTGRSFIRVIDASISENGARQRRNRPAEKVDVGLLRRSCRGSLQARSAT
jgi:hypothetical protein